MITTADALEIMAVVAACHQRTAPRMDDRDVAMATASVWVELFNEYDFGKAELIAGVKNRATVCPDAPEAADIIRIARSTRSERMARTSLPETEPGQDTDDPHYPGNSKAAPDPAEFPAYWSTEQRTSAYWYAVSLHAMPQSTAGWHALAEQIKRKQRERERVKS